MKISVNKDQFVQTLSKVQNIINSRSNLPILSHILIEANNKGIQVSATDLDLGVTTFLETKVIETGAITAPARKIFEIVKELSENDINISVKKNNSINIETTNCFFKLLGLPKEEFPQLPDFKDKDSVQLSQTQLLRMLEMTSFAVSRDETRYVLNGILFELSHDALKLIATDGRRLAVVENKTQSQKQQNFILPSKAVIELQRHLKDSDGDVNLVLSENQVLFEFGNTSLISRLIEGDFPNYKQVIPKEQYYRILLDRTQFLAGLRRANLLATSDYQSVRLEIFKDKVVVAKSTPDLGESREEIAAQYNGKELVIGFNPQYLIEALKVLTSADISFEVFEPEKPALIREDGYVYIVLPMKI